MTSRVRKILPRPGLTLGLTLIWLLLNNSLAIGTIVLGVLIGLLIPPFLGTRPFPRLRLKRPFALMAYMLLVLYDIITANFVVARQVLGRNNALKPQFLVVPLALTHPVAISLFASTITLTPGTVSCEIAEDRSHLLVHALHTDDPEAEVRAMKHRYEARIRRIFAEPPVRKSSEATKEVAG